MITFFSVLKPCEGRTGLAQAQAVRSWAALGAPSDVLLLGDEHGVEDLAQATGARWLPHVGRNANGTPLLDAAIRLAREASATPLLCLVNGDIVLDGRFADAARILSAQLPRFLMVGQCLNLDVPDPLMTGSTPAGELAALAREHGTLRGHDYVDYFLFGRDLFVDVPPFALGRAGFDNWLVWRARASRAAVVDASAFQLPVHQNHDYGHIAGGVAEAYRGDEAAENLRLAGGRLLSTLDSTHRLAADGLRLDPLGRLRLRRRILHARMAAARALGSAGR